MSAPLAIQHLSKRYGRIEAVRDLSLVLNQGEIFGLLGPNGAGKTTLLECLIGLREPDRGSIEICGIDARRAPRAARVKTGVVLQQTWLQEKITPREALRLFASFYRAPVKADELLGRFNLGPQAGAAFDTLSGGQRQRLALALAFVGRPQLLVLDEPTAALDPQSRRALHEDIRRLRDDGCTILISTHNLEEAEKLCDRVAVIDHGAIVATGAPRDLLRESGALQSITLTTRPPLAPERLRALPAVTAVRSEGDSARIETSATTTTLAALTALLAEQRSAIVELRVQPASLEDVFLRLTRSDESAPTP
jgi:ABC-2 type transport system ATP-binding protein